jgi:hypothetical protein
MMQIGVLTQRLEEQPAEGTEVPVSRIARALPALSGARRARHVVLTALSQPAGRPRPAIVTAAPLEFEILHPELYLG